MSKRVRQRGSTAVEVALMMPWLAFLFVGILDMGFYSFAAISTQNAARAVALQGANGLPGGCAAAIGELKWQANMSNVTTCVSAPASITSTQPVAVCTGQLSSTSASVCGLPSAVCADCGTTACTTNETCTSVQGVVTYETIQMVPIPGILTGKLRLTRIAEMRNLN